MKQIAVIPNFSRGAVDEGEVAKTGIREWIEHAKLYEALKENNFAVIERFAPQGGSKDRARARSLEGYFSSGNFSRLK